MLRHLFFFRFAGAAFFALTFSSLAQEENSRPFPLTDLDRYVHAKDSSYGYELKKKGGSERFDGYILDLTSQTWRTKSEVNRILWKHDLNIIVPKKVDYKTALLVIGGGSNREDPNPSFDQRALQMALGTNSIVADLSQVPNQPLRFAGEERDRSEDATIAYTWDKFLRTGESKWVLQLPMAKSAVRAMDAIQEFCKSEEGGGHQIDNFVVAGASKRGWTTWLTAVVDKRVKGIAPIVIDMLNVVPSFKHHYQAYGFFAPAVGDYQEMGIMEWMDSPEYRALVKLVEPYEYRERLTLPKFMINGSGDQFFLPDSSQFYWDDLVGPKGIRYVPNADHGLGGSDAVVSLVAFYERMLRDKPLPKYSWEVKGDQITVQFASKPAKAKLWHAENPDKRDFRKDVIGAGWESEDLEIGEGEVKGTLKTAEKGWAASFVELTFAEDGVQPLKCTTGVTILPNKLPSKPYQPKEVPKGFLQKK